MDVPVRGRLVVNGITDTHRAMRAGAGIGLLASYMVEDDIAHGRLVRLLDGCRAAELPVSAVYPHRMCLAVKVKTFVDFLADRVARHGLGGAAPAAAPGPGGGKRRR